MKHGKKYEAALKLIDINKAYTILEATTLVKKTSTVKFDATVDVSYRLNVDTTQADQQIRGTIVLPHGNGKTKKVLAVTTSKTADAHPCRPPQYSLTIVTTSRKACHEFENYPSSSCYSEI